jgi:hypothetical protein
MAKKYNHKIYRDRHREKLKKAGLCIMCGKNKPKETSSQCEQCTKRSIDNRKKLKEKRVLEGFCSNCLKRKPIKNKKMCKKCTDMRKLSDKQKLRKRCLSYGITEDDYKEIFDRQNGLCFICERPPNGRWDNLVIDHCHKTEKVRGLLCGSCNKSLGCFLDNKNILRNAILYLQINQT